MLHQQGRQLLYILIIMLSSMANVFAQTDSNPCTAGLEVLTLTDRGGYVNSPCVLPFKTMFLEGGYQYQGFINPSGWMQTYPQVELRFGLPGNTEIALFAPNYNRVNESSFSGYSPLLFDIKHPFAFSQNWIVTGTAIFILPGGSAAAGSADVGSVWSAILTYSLSDQWSVTGMLEENFLTTPTLDGGEHVNIFIPDLLLSYSPIEKVNFYGEIYSLSKTGPGENGAVIIDSGVVFALTPKIAVDLGLYRQLGNNPFYFKNSFVGGITVDLG